MLLLVAEDRLLRLASVPDGPLEAVELMPGANDPDGDVEVPTELGTEPVANSVLVALLPAVLARLSAVGTLELVALDSAYGWDEVDEFSSGLAELGYPEDVPETGVGRIGPEDTDDCDVGVENDVEVLAPEELFGTVSITGAVENRELSDCAEKLEFAENGVTVGRMDPELELGLPVDPETGGGRVAGAPALEVVGGPDSVPLELTPDNVYGTEDDEVIVLLEPEDGDTPVRVLLLP